MSAMRVVIRFRDGAVKELPDPKSHVINGRGYNVVYKEGVVTIMDPYDVWTAYPLDIILSVEETPQARF